MQYYKCKCGDKTSYGSIGPAPCEGCEKCGTNLAFHPEYLGKPVPHEWRKKFNEDTGEPYMICKNCFKRDVPQWL